MNEELKQDLVSLKADLSKTAREITEGKKQVKKIQEEREVEREELRKIQALKQPLIRDLNDQIEAGQKRLHALRVEEDSERQKYEREQKDWDTRLTTTRKSCEILLEKEAALNRKKDEVEQEVHALESLLESRRTEHRNDESSHTSRIERLRQDILELEGLKGSLEHREGQVAEREARVKEREAALSVKENELSEREKAIVLKEEITEDMFQEMKSKYKKHGVPQSQSRNS